MSVYLNPPSSSSPPSAPESSQASLSRDTSALSTDSSSSSLLTAPVPIRNHAASGASSPIYGSPSRGGRPPAWLSRHFRRDSEPTEHASVVKPTPSPALSAATRPRMASPNDFEFGEELGGGSWSTVVEAVYPPTSKRYAIKILNKAQLLKEKMTRYAVVEKDALALLSSGEHPGIVRLYSAFHDSTSLYLVLSLAPNGDLRELVKRVGSFSPPCARYYTAQIVDTVQWIHSKGVLHRDLKPENILFDHAMRIVLTDFGSAYISKDLDLSPRQSTFVGTAAYVSPELLLGHVKTTSRSSDIWAIGCILYFLMVGRSPFLALNDYLSFKKIEALDYTFPEGFNSDAQDLVQRLLVLDPSDRLGVPPKSSTTELREHPFFIGQDQSGSNGCALSYIKWDTLWTDPPVPIESGLVQTPPLAAREADAHAFSWDAFVNEFSLVMDEDPSVQPPLDPEKIQRGDTKNSLEAEIQENDQASIPHLPSNPTLSAPEIALSHSIPHGVPTDEHSPISDEESNSSPSPVEGTDLMIKISSWSSTLIPLEKPRLVAEVDTRSRHRLIQKVQRRVLVLTTSPRILCVKLGSISGAKSSFVANPIVIKQEFTFPHVRAVADPRPRNEITAVSLRGDCTLVLDTSEKDYAYITHDHAEANRWVKEVQTLLASAQIGMA